MKPDQSTTESDLTPFGELLFRMAIDANQPEAVYTMGDFSVQAELSIQLNVIAEALYRCALITAGQPLEGATAFRDLSLALQQRNRYLAERAIATIDPKVRLTFQEEAARETDDWVNGPYDPDNKPTPKNIADYAIGSYESKLAGVRADVTR